MVALAASVAPHGGAATAALLPGFQTAFFGAAVAAFLVMVLLPAALDVQAASS